MTDILDLIDQATAPVCGWCQAELRPDGPSEFFCDAEHQFEWNRLRGEALTNYREPTDLAAHVNNLREEFSPEVTPGLGRFGVVQAGYPPMGASFCSHGSCRRPAPRAELCALHRADRDASFPAGVGRFLQALLGSSLGSSEPGDGPPYTHTFTPGEPDSEEGRPLPPTYTVMRRGVLEIGPEGPSGPTVEVPYVRLEFDDGNFRESIGAALQQIAASGQAAVDAVHGLAEVLDDHRLPADPRERALELRRRRNTGPQQRQRAPRRINPRGCL